MQAPRTSRASLVKGRSHANAGAQQALIGHWQSIVKSLDNYLKIMKSNYVSFIVDVYMELCCRLFLHLRRTVFYNLILICIITGPGFLSQKSFHSNILIYQCSTVQQVSLGNFTCRTTFKFRSL